MKIGTVRIHEFVPRTAEARRPPCRCAAELREKQARGSAGIAVRALTRRCDSVQLSPRRYALYPRVDAVILAFPAHCGPRGKSGAPTLGQKRWVCAVAPEQT